MASTIIITADEATKTLIGEIDDLIIKINGIIVPIKVLELELSQNGQQTHVPAMYSHFKTTYTTASLIKFNDKEKKPT
ncbi:hypothetical protein G9A89_002624 [Geosiphon pyriformis]|nr:hypothetical protein G9A89_002624 [Geosiphon pyriformis]